MLWAALTHPRRDTVLARELGRVQERSTRLIAEMAGEVERLNALLLQARAESMGKASRLAFMSEDLAELEALNMGLRQKLAATTKSLEALADEAAHAACAAFL